MQLRSWLAVAALVVLGIPGGASAQREHTVRPGQSLARIAARYEVSVDNLAAANQLRRDAQLRPGMTLRVPERGIHYVGHGETLASIARQNGCSVTDLQRLNRLSGDSLRLGQRLQLPGFASIQEQETAARRWGRPRSPGVARLYRRAGDRRVRVRLLDSRGRARSAARRSLQELMRTNPRNRADSGPLPPPRLIEILARVSDHFGGREITIVSGYRPAGGYTRETSQHIAGNALDLRVRGVPNTDLRDYLRASFPNVGVGYYPRSHFIHLDVRDRATYWVDWSAPGEAPDYQRPGDAPPADASEEEAASTGLPRPRRAPPPAERANDDHDHDEAEEG
ncbi:MAG: LysM peptidoglycan-binding domain-containing protein [Sandaracinaceae bacterium]|nr:LysM peptidoglycan-binding domain-containing protein [Sandaracinaceae bacterium]